MRDFLPARLELYESRKQEMERKLSAIVVELGNKHRFCSMVVDGSLNLFKKKRVDIEALLDTEGFALHPERGSYAYLTGTSILDLTAEKLSDLADKLASKETELTVLQGKTAKDLWVQDLSELRELVAR